MIPALQTWISEACWQAAQLPEGQELYHPFTQHSSKEDEAQKDEGISAESYPWWDLGVKASSENFPPNLQSPF